jgi:hypothetical protein
MSDLLLVQFNQDCGRMGDIEGLFVCAEEDLNNVIGKEVYYGEILGKHSEIYGTLRQSNINVVSKDQDKIKWLVSVIGSNTISGYNPIEIWKERNYEYDNED